MNLKYTALISAAMLAVLTFADCGSDSSSKNTSASHESSSDSDHSSDNDSKAKEKENSQTVIASADSYSVVAENLGDEVYYAQITGMSDEAVQESINKMLKECEESRHMPTSNYSAMPEVFYCDDEILSMQLAAEFKSGGSSITKFNINMKTGEDIELSDFVDFNALAEKLYNNDGITIVSGYDGASIPQFLEESHCETVEDVYKKLESVTFFYFDENKNVVLHLTSSSGTIDITAG